MLPLTQMISPTGEIETGYHLLAWARTLYVKIPTGFSLGSAAMAFDVDAHNEDLPTAQASRPPNTTRHKRGKHGSKKSRLHRRDYDAVLRLMSLTLEMTKLHTQVVHNLHRVIELNHHHTMQRLDDNMLSLYPASPIVATGTTGSTSPIAPPPVPSSPLLQIPPVVATDTTGSLSPSAPPTVRFSPTLQISHVVATTIGSLSPSFHPPPNKTPRSSLVFPSTVSPNASLCLSGPTPMNVALKKNHVTPPLVTPPLACPTPTFPGTFGGISWSATKPVSPVPVSLRCSALHASIESSTQTTSICVSIPPKPQPLPHQPSYVKAFLSIISRPRSHLPWAYEHREFSHVLSMANPLVTRFYPPARYLLDQFPDHPG